MTRARVSALLLLSSFSTVGCSSGSTLAGSTVEFAGSSQQTDVERVYFQVPEGETCAGALVRTNGDERVLSFVRAGAGVEVDLIAHVSTEEPWMDLLYVEVPIPEEIRRRGGRVAIVAADGLDRRPWAELTYAVPAGDTQAGSAGR